MKYFPVAIFCIFLISCESKKSIKIEVVNPSAINLKEKAVVVKRSDIHTIPEGTLFPVVTTSGGDTLASQLDDLDSDGRWDELFWVADIEANKKEIFYLSFTEKEVVFEKRTSIRSGKRLSKDAKVIPITMDTIYASQIHAKLGYEPYQTDGPSFENDKVGFRHYFDGRNSKDLFGKKASYMSPETVGISETGSVEDNYHVMADWGRDILAVGNSVGIGGLNLVIGDSISRLGCLAKDTITNIEYAVFNTVTEGPVRSVISFDYHNWRPLDRTYQVSEEVKIWPGMYAFQNTVNVFDLQGDEALLVGLVNSNTENPLKEIMVNDKYVILLTHDQQTYDKTWWLGLGLILPKDVYLGYGEAPKEGVFSTSYYGKLKVEENKPVTYYAVGCWELSDERFKDPVFFEQYIIDLANQLSVDLQINVR